MSTAANLIDPHLILAFVTGKKRLTSRTSLPQSLARPAMRHSGVWTGSIATSRLSPFINVSPTIEQSQDNYHQNQLDVGE